MAEYNPTHLNMQTTSTAGTKPLFEPVVNRYVIENAKEKLVFNQFGQRVKIPRGKTKTISWDKCEPLPVSTQTLTEGVTPEGTALEVTRISAEPGQYGRYVTTTDEFDFYKHDPSPEVLRLAEKLSNNAAETFDRLTMLTLAAATNIQYAGGKTSYTALTASDVFSVAEIRKAVRTLQTNKGEHIDDSFVCIVDPALAYDLQGDSAWTDVKNYDPKDLYAGEIGKLYGVRFVMTTQDLSLVVSSAGSDGETVATVKPDIHCAYFIAKNAYGSTSEKGNVETIWKNKGSGGTADPLEQRSTAGWKGHHLAKILTEAWIVKAVCKVSA